MLRCLLVSLHRGKSALPISASAHVRSAHPGLQGVQPHFLMPRGVQAKPPWSTIPGKWHAHWSTAVCPWGCVGHPLRPYTDPLATLVRRSAGGSWTSSVLPCWAPHVVSSQKSKKGARVETTTNLHLSSNKTFLSNSRESLVRQKVSVVHPGGFVCHRRLPSMQHQSCALLMLSNSYFWGEGKAHTHTHIQASLAAFVFSFKQKWILKSPRAHFFPDYIQHKW